MEAWRAIDQRPPDLGIAIREQGLERDVGKERVAIVLVPVGHGQLDRLDDRVYIVCRQVAHALQVKTLEQAQRLAEVRPLGPGVTLADRVPPVLHGNRILDPGHMSSQVLLAHKAALGQVKGNQLVGDVSPVKAVADRLEVGLARAGAAAFGLDQPAHRGCQERVPLQPSGVEQGQHGLGRGLERLGSIEPEGGDAQVDGPGDRRGLEVSVGRDVVLHVPVDGCLG